MAGNRVDEIVRELFAALPLGAGAREMADRHVEAMEGQPPHLTALIATTVVLVLHDMTATYAGQSAEDAVVAQARGVRGDFDHAAAERLRAAVRRVHEELPGVTNEEGLLWRFRPRKRR